MLQRIKTEMSLSLREVGKTLYFLTVLKSVFNSEVKRSTVFCEGYPLKFDQSVYVIAEIGINHNGDMNRAFSMIEEAKNCGADVAKFQTFKTELLVQHSEPKMPYQQINDLNPESQFEMLKKVELNEQQHIALINHCRKVGIHFLSTPYDKYSADLLVKLGCKTLKIASTDSTNLPFLRYVVSLGCEIILSTGVTELTELRQVMADLKLNFLGQIKLLHCVSNYPAPLDEINLSVIRELKREFGCETGFSDHTDDLDVGAYAVMGGARVIEKHFTFDKGAPGPDHKASLMPDQLRVYISNIRKAEKCLGDGIKRVTPSERKIKERMQKRLVARETLDAGRVLTADDLWAMRPAQGISPLEIDVVLGKKLKNKLERFSPVQWENLQ